MADTEFQKLLDENERMLREFAALADETDDGDDDCDSKVIRNGSVLVKANKLDSEAQRFAVQEIDGCIYYYNKSFFQWCSIPKSWIELIVWTDPAEIAHASRRHRDA